MFYDIIQSNGSSKKTDTIVLYDIAGENCRSAADMVRFARFIEHSDGLILLIDPKQLNFTSDCDEENVDAPSLALNTLHGVITGQQGRKCTIPMAVCVSKSDQCFDILPSMAQEHIQVARRNEMGVIAKEFDGSAYNQLSQEMTRLIENNALSVCNILQDNYLNFNFFAVSAIGCDCTKNENGVFCSLYEAGTPPGLKSPSCGCLSSSVSSVPIPRYCVLIPSSSRTRKSGNPVFWESAENMSEWRASWLDMRRKKSAKPSSGKEGDNHEVFSGQLRKTG